MNPEAEKEEAAEKENRALAQVLITECNGCLPEPHEGNEGLLFRHFGFPVESVPQGAVVPE